jgi:hypothetical protein
MLRETRRFSDDLREAIVKISPAVSSYKRGEANGKGVYTVKKKSL